MEFDVREKVKEHYGRIASQVGAAPPKSCCCGPSSSCCSDISATDLLYNQENLEGLPQEAVNASLGCANPLSFAALQEGETVLDLGSGGGIDAFLAAKYVGSRGKVLGLDMTEEMLALANANKQKMGVANVEFIKGYIEEIPLPEASVDVVISNCVINLAEDKARVLQEAYRVLKMKGRFAVADIVALKEVPEGIKQAAEVWVQCVAGALHVDAYRDLLQRAGFSKIEIRPVHIYTKEVIHQLIGANKELQAGLAGLDLETVDGAFAGAEIVAWK